MQQTQGDFQKWAGRSAKMHQRLDPHGPLDAKVFNFASDYPIVQVGN